MYAHTYVCMVVCLHSTYLFVYVCFYEYMICCLYVGVYVCNDVFMLLCMYVFTCQDICVPDIYVPAKTVQNAKSVQDIWFPDKIVPKLSRLLPH